MAYNQIHKKEIEIIFWNAQGLMSKKGKISAEVKHLIYDKDDDVVAISEAKLSKRSPPRLKGYKYFYNPTNNPKVYGQLIYYKIN